VRSLPPFTNWIIAIGFLAGLTMFAAACGDKTGEQIAAPAATSPQASASPATTPGAGGGASFASCDESVSWIDAARHVDERVAIQGPEISVNRVTQGNDDFIQLAIGLAADQPGGVDVFVPVSSAPEFQTPPPNTTICVRGVLQKRDARYAIYIENSTDVAQLPLGAPTPVVATPNCSDAISWQDAAAHANDDSVDVKGPVVGLAHGAGPNDPLLLQLGTTSGDEGFDVAIPAYAIDHFDLDYQGKTICVRGAISIVDGRPRTLVERPGGIVTADQ
jgi:hypothetical protein